MSRVRSPYPAPGFPLGQAASSLDIIPPLMAASERLPQPHVALRLALTAVALVLWFWTQSLIGTRVEPESGIGDRLHDSTASLNLYLQSHPNAANALLIGSSGIIDLLGIFLLARWIVRGDVRPFLSLVFVLGLRQIMQACVALPAPPGAIWHYPGFPSLLVTYNVAHDYFFSGHTAIAVLGAVELARFGKRWLTVTAIGIVIFEAATVLILRAHYTMDVFTGVITALYVAHLVSGIQDRASRARVAGKG
jgi:hypothetical protein